MRLPLDGDRDKPIHSFRDNPFRQGSE